MTNEAADIIEAKIKLTTADGFVFETFRAAPKQGGKAHIIGIVAPAKTPAAIIVQLQKGGGAGLSSGPATGQMTSAGFAAFIKADDVNMKEAAKLAGLKPK